MKQFYRKGCVPRRFCRNKRHVEVRVARDLDVALGTMFVGHHEPTGNTSSRPLSPHLCLALSPSTLVSLAARPVSGGRLRYHKLPLRMPHRPYRRTECAEPQGHRSMWRRGFPAGGPAPSEHRWMAAWPISEFRGFTLNCRGTARGRARAGPAASGLIGRRGSPLGRVFLHRYAGVPIRDWA